MGIAVAARRRGRGERLDQRLLHEGPGEPVLGNDAGMKLYKSIMAKYAPAGAKVTDGLYIYGMAKAYTFVQALKAAGPNPTRASLMKAVLNMNDKTNPFLLPGVVTKTGPNDYFPISQQQLITFNNGTWTPVRPGRRHAAEGLAKLCCAGAGLSPAPVSSAPAAHPDAGDLRWVPIDEIRQVDRSGRRRRRARRRRRVGRRAGPAEPCVSGRPTRSSTRRSTPRRRSRSRSSAPAIRRRRARATPVRCSSASATRPTWSWRSRIGSSRCSTGTRRRPPGRATRRSARTCEAVLLEVDDHGRQPCRALERCQRRDDHGAGERSEPGLPAVAEGARRRSRPPASRRARASRAPAPSPPGTARPARTSPRARPRRRARRG